MDAFELPLFPLNTVLFPGMPLHLHIFEDRYKQMIRRCLENGQPFGVVLIRKGLEALGPLADPYAVGTTARIVQTQTLNQGRMNVLTVGQDRFRTLTLDAHSHAYLVGNIELFPLEDQNHPGLPAALMRLKPLLVRYLQDLSRYSEAAIDLQQVPDDPVVLAYLGAIALQAPEARKQELLAIPSAIMLLDEMIGCLRRELALLSVLGSPPGGKKIGGFSEN